MENMIDDKLIDDMESVTTKEYYKIGVVPYVATYQDGKLIKTEEVTDENELAQNKDYILA